jgi:hypothetical protein
MPKTIQTVLEKVHLKMEIMGPNTGARLLCRRFRIRVSNGSQEHPRVMDKACHQARPGGHRSYDLILEDELIVNL